MTSKFKIIFLSFFFLCCLSFNRSQASPANGKSSEAELPQQVNYVPGFNNILYVNQSVDQTAAGYTGVGDSWANAIPELADALKWANDNKAADLWDANNPLKIYVAKGTYKPKYTPEDGKGFSADEQYARDRTFLMVKDVELYGGFDPANGVTELTHVRILPDKDGASPNGTILSGDLNGNDVVGTMPGRGGGADIW